MYIFIKKQISIGGSSRKSGQVAAPRSPTGPDGETPTQSFARIGADSF